MAKLKPDAISKSDLLEYLNSYSDFSFELAVLKMLRGRRIDCEHGGHYEDPVTNKSREFDIRATKTIDRFRVRMPIECKNIRENFPILISCVPRQQDETYHQIALVSEPTKKDRESYIIPFHLQQPRAVTLSINEQHSLYKVNEPVGKSTVQVGRAMDNSVSSNDSELYEKWGQCLGSANDLVKRVYEDGSDDKKAYMSAVIPFVVVPNDRLWSVVYDEDGTCTDEPKLTSRVSCFINKDYQMGNKLAGATMWLSHVEVVTFDGLSAFIETYLSGESGMEKIFPKEGILNAYQRTHEKRS